MPLNVVSNYAANVAHRNLQATDIAASNSLAKLSIGKRVVSARDDAASMAIGSRMQSEVMGLKQAVINAGQAGPIDARHWATDRRAFGADRSQLLQQIACRSVVESTADSFGMLRDGYLASYLGPLIAVNSAQARQIAMRLIARTERTVFWDIPGPNAAALQLAQSLGFEPCRSLTRMIFGRRVAAPFLTHQYAIADPSIG